MKQDLIYALRMLRKRPAFVVFAVLTLALGIGANTVIFSGVYTLLLRSLPYPHAERLVVLSQTLSTGSLETGVSYADFLDWSAQSREFDGLAAVRTSTVNLTVGSVIERASGSYVSAGLFPLLGARATLGRTTLADEHRAGAARVVVLGYGFWQRRFGGDPGIIGREIRLNDEPMTVVGVLDAEFQYPFRADFWSPLETNDSPDTLADREATHYEITGRLREGGSLAGAVRELRAIQARRLDGKDARGGEGLVQGVLLREALPGLVKYRAPLAALQLAVVFVLLIASVNLANLLLARHTERRQEFAVRLALGAGRARLLRQLLVEAALVGALGAVLGLIGAHWGLEALRVSMGSLAGRVPGLAEVEINAPVLGFTLAVTLIVTLGFGLIPALIASRQDINEWLKSGAANATGDGRRRRWSRRLATAEIALAVMLLAAAGLMIRTFLNLTKEDPGFRADAAVAVSLAPPPSRYPDTESLAAYYDEAIRRLAALPGVTAVGGVGYMPLVGYNPETVFSVDGEAGAAAGAGVVSGSGDERRRADIQPTTPDYFRAIGMPLVGGREFSTADMQPAPVAAIVNQAFVRKYLSGGDPVGRRLQLENGRQPMTIVGVVGDVRQFGLHTEPRPEIYVPQHRPAMTLIVRAGGDLRALAEPVRETVRRLDDRAAFGLKTLEQAVAASIEKRRLFAQMFGILAGAALLLAVCGIYGVISYMTAQRMREFGVRAALGATGGDLRRLVLSEGLRITMVGIVCGWIGSLALTRVIRSLLYGVSAVDPLIFTGIGVLLAVVALAACALPAYRASRVDPMRALREE